MYVTEFLARPCISLFGAFFLSLCKDSCQYDDISMVYAEPYLVCNDGYLNKGCVHLFILE